MLYTSLSCSLPSGLSRRERQLAGYTRTLPNTFPVHLRLSVGPVPAGATTGGLHQDATEHLPGAFAALRRACPGGSDNWRATPGRYRTPSRCICGSPSGLSRREHDLQATCVPTQSLLPPGQARRRARYLASLGSQPVVIPPGQARRKSHGLVWNNKAVRPAVGLRLNVDL